MKQAAPLPYRDLAKLIEGEATASETAELQATLAQSPESRQRLLRVEAVAAHLGDTTAVDEIDLLPDLEQRFAARIPSAPAARRWWRAPRWLGLGLPAVAILLALPALLLRDGGSASKPEHSYRAKSATPHLDARARWIALNVFRLSGDAAPEPLGDVLHLDDGLLFSYTNLGPAPFSFLMVFGVDEQRRVYWYYPAFMDARDDPKAIDIQKGVSRFALDEVIAHPYQLGTLTLFGLFSDHALSVSALESAVGRGLGDGTALEATFDGIRVKTLRVRVVR
jgi:hypothetical protein